MFQFLNGISTTEYILIALILVVLFGPKIAKALGRTGGSTFKEVKKIKNEFNKVVNDDDDKETGKK